MAEGCTSAEYDRMHTIKVIEHRPASWAAESIDDAKHDREMLVRDGNGTWGITAWLYTEATERRETGESDEVERDSVDWFCDEFNARQAFTGKAAMTGECGTCGLSFVDDGEHDECPVCRGRGRRGEDPRQLDPRELERLRAMVGELPKISIAEIAKNTGLGVDEEVGRG